MRILHVSSASAFGGGERHLTGLVGGLAQDGHEVFLALRDPALFQGRLGPIQPANIFALPLRNALDLSSALRLARLLRDKRIDIIHAHVARDYPLAAFAARQSGGVRLVLTRHVLFPLGRLHRIALSNVSRVIAVSQAVAHSLRDQRIFDPARIVVVANGVDTERFIPARPSRPESGGRQLRIGIVGELSAVKAQEDFLRMASVVARALPGRVEFLIAGEDHSPSKAYRARLEGLIDELELNGCALLSGHINDQEIPALVASCDVLVSTSRHEAFGVAMVEAMACGIPVVATATDGAREIVENGVTGVITPVGETAIMAEVVLSLLRDDSRRSVFGQRAAETARRRFGLRRMVEETERVYVEALDSSP